MAEIFLRRRESLCVIERERHADRQTDKETKIEYFTGELEIFNFDSNYR